MTRDEITAALIDELGRIAPETDASRIDPNADLREELDIDSMDFLNLVTASPTGCGPTSPKSTIRSSPPSAARPTIWHSGSGWPRKARPVPSPCDFGDGRAAPRAALRPRAKGQPAMTGKVELEPVPRSEGATARSLSGSEHR
jgi:hypothetical protein